ncbi:MAG: transporter substrate-binding domain-containing protein [Geminicoccaceae bacterium]|nr:transporter substrate-binding domain-containing protein [Geminicoccaceae bacterium]
MNVFKKAAAVAAALALLAGYGAPTARAQTPDEIKSRGTINIGMLVDFPPFGILDLEGKPDGYDADVAKLLAEDMGVEANLVPVTGPNRIPYLLSNQVDILVASLGITEERAKQVDFSQPYAGIEIFVVGDTGVEVKNADDLAGKSVGVARASTQDTAITGMAPKSTNIQRFDDDATAVQALLSGQVPLIGASNTVIAQIDQAAPGRFDKKFQLRQQSQGIATRPGATEMMAYVNDFLTRKKESGELNALYEKWIGAPLPDFVLKTTK